MSAIPKEILQGFDRFSPRVSPTSPAKEPQSREDIEDVGELRYILSDGIDVGLTASDYLFVFDVENAHDGLCNGDNCL